jgi:hypothetical protein
MFWTQFGVDHRNVLATGQDAPDDLFQLLSQRKIPFVRT